MKLNTNLCVVIFFPLVNLVEVTVLLETGAPPWFVDIDDEKMLPPPKSDMRSSKGDMIPGNMEDRLLFQLPPLRPAKNNLKKKFNNLRSGINNTNSACIMHSTVYNPIDRQSLQKNKNYPMLNTVFPTSSSVMTSMLFRILPLQILSLQNFFPIG